MKRLAVSLRPGGRKVIFLATALCLLIAQMVWLTPNQVQAANTPLTYIDHLTTEQLTDYPLNIIDIAVRDSVLSVVGADGQVYTKDGAVPGLTDVAKAYVSRTVGFAIKNDGTLWSWGRGFQLGRIHDPGNTGENQDDPTPDQVTGLPALTDIQIGERHVLALDVNGNVWSWGENNSLQLGTDPTCPGPALPHSDNCDIESFPNKYPE
jgi:alpha-tubulin suppressor-like RCC1 family protein